MDRHDIDWSGYFAATPTPFHTDGSLDLPALRRLVSYFVDEGSRGIVVNGTSGEWCAQSVDERKSVAEAVVGEIDHAVPTIVGVSSTRLQETEHLIQHACGIGASGVMLSPPPGWRLAPTEIVAFYRHMCEKTPVPVMLYNAPGDVGTNLTPALVETLAQLPPVVAVKEATPDDRQFLATARLVGRTLRVFGNVVSRQGIALMTQEHLADGFIGGGMLLGRQMADFFDAVERGDVAHAQTIADRFVSLGQALHVADGNGVHGGLPGQLKALLALAGQPAGEPRFPRLPVTDEALDALRRILSSKERSLR